MAATEVELKEAYKQTTRMQGMCKTIICFVYMPGRP